MSKYLMVNDEVAVFYTNEENPKMIARWGLGVLEKCNSNDIPKKLEEVPVNMEKVLDKLIEGKEDFFPLDGTIKYPLIYDECSDEVKELIDETDDDAMRKHYNLNSNEELYM